MNTPHSMNYDFAHPFLWMWYEYKYEYWKKCRIHHSNGFGNMHVSLYIYAWWKRILIDILSTYQYVFFSFFYAFCKSIFSFLFPLKKVTARLWCMFIARNIWDATGHFLFLRSIYQPQRSQDFKKERKGKKLETDPIACFQKFGSFAKENKRKPIIYSQ